MKKYKVSEEEKEYIWKKIEYVKKNKAIQSKNTVYNLLNNSDITSYTIEELKILYNSLEYSFKQKIKGVSKEIDKFVFHQVKKLFSVVVVKEEEKK